MGIKSIIGVAYTCLAVVSFNVSAIIIEGGAQYLDEIGSVIALDFVAEVDDSYTWLEGANGDSTGMPYSITFLQLFYDGANHLDYLIAPPSITFIESMGDIDTIYGDYSDDWWEVNIELSFGTYQLQSFGGYFHPTIGETILSDPMGSHYINVKPSNVPEPATALLIGSGLLGLIGVARRKKA